MNEAVEPVVQVFKLGIVENRLTARGECKQPKLGVRWVVDRHHAVEEAEESEHGCMCRVANDLSDNPLIPASERAVPLVEALRSGMRVASWWPVSETRERPIHGRRKDDRLDCRYKVISVHRRTISPGLLMRHSRILAHRGVPSYPLPTRLRTNVPLPLPQWRGGRGMWLRSLLAKDGEDSHVT